MKITTIVIDCDGCLTDGRQYITEGGSKLCKTFHSRDRMALRRILEAGYRVIIASADDWPGVRAWAETITAPDGRHVEFVYTRKKEELDLNWDEVLGVGDDMEDWKFLKQCAIAYAPKDADDLILGGEYIFALPVKGGRGIMSQIEIELAVFKDDYDAIHS